MIKHLKGLAAKTEETDSEGELVENTNDLEAVKIMTIHASKGLEFPIVIMVGSLKEYYNNPTGPFVYNKDQRKYLGFDKDTTKDLVFKEWRRLIYVAYTRAKYILILPDFSTIRNWSYNGYPFKFLAARIKDIRDTEFVRNEEHKWGKKEEKDKNYIFNEEDDLNAIVKDYVDKERKNTNTDSEKKDAETQIVSLKNSIPSLRMYQLSYSSISSNLKDKFETDFNNNSYYTDNNSDEFVVTEDFGRVDKEDSSDDNIVENDSIILQKFKDIDNSENIIKACPKYSPIIDNNNEANNFPKGARLGNAIHEILELIIFENYGKLKADKIFDISELNNLIIEKFEKQSLPIKNNDNWVKLTAQILWNTLNADLPVIQGNKVIEGKTFKLKSILTKARKAEVEFLFDFKDKKLNKLCKGFIDLLFVRKDNENEYYSILDWKSDYMSEESYWDGDALSDKVAEEYTVQRVLYSYLLIKWLKQFYSGLSEEEIFNSHFGGIYYAFVRGCKADCSNGIYAQTWKSYSALEESYKKLLKELRE